MKVVVVFVVDVDIIDIPQSVMNHMEGLRNEFLGWVYRKSNSNPYRKTVTTVLGNTYAGVIYRSEAFVEWLNSNILFDSDECSSVVKSCVHKYPEDLPKIFL